MMMMMMCQWRIYNISMDFYGQLFYEINMNVYTVLT